MKNKTIIFTDGSSRGNPGPGGWAAVVVDGNHMINELGGYEKMTTNNRMELTAALRGIAAVTGDEIVVYSDSSYVINGITKWVKGWKRNGWLTKTKDEVQNRDLWEALSSAVSDKKVEWKYVGGHIGIVGNERCDHIATDFADGNKVDLFHGDLSQYDLPNILEISADSTKLASKSSSRKNRNLKAYSYVSAVAGQIEVHQSWAECEKRVKGTKGAKYKKSFDSADEAKIIAEFEAI